MCELRKVLESFFLSFEYYMRRGECAFESSALPTSSQMQFACTRLLLGPSARALYQLFTYDDDEDYNENDENGNLIEATIYMLFVLSIEKLKKDFFLKSKRKWKRILMTKSQISDPFLHSIEMGFLFVLYNKTG